MTKTRATAAARNPAPSPTATIRSPPSRRLPRRARCSPMGRASSRWLIPSLGVLPGVQEDVVDLDAPTRRCQAEPNRVGGEQAAEVRQEERDPRRGPPATRGIDVARVEDAD